ncbi:MAG: SPASM domain-containing protein [Rhodospirillales bacterium]|nr:SPASM domain-containing protein [Rhodospirillales bacterium]
MIEKLFSLKKLTFISISVYGHDLESFKRVTGKPDKQYRKLVDNLNRIADHRGAGRKFMEIHLRTDRSFTWHPEDGIDDNSSELVKAMHRAIHEGGLKWLGNQLLYDTWGGMVNSEDVADLDIEMSDGSNLPKIGACYLLFDEPMIFADGGVNACACRGVDRTLQIGDLNNSTLRQVLSSENAVYHNIINRHQKNDYPETCKDCTIYRSVYRRPRGWSYTSIAAFFKKHDERAGINRY